MLVIRMQRTGRKGHAQFRVVVQDSRRTPTSGKIVAHLGHFNPHSKETVIDKERASFYMEHGAQPSDRVIRLLKAEGIQLPSWVKEPAQGKRATRNPEKRRSTTPAEEVEVDNTADASEEAPAEEASKTPEEETPAADDSAEDQSAESK